MTNDQGAPRHENLFTGEATEVVQARDVAGGIHFHYGPGSKAVAPQQLPRGVRIFVNRVADLTKLDELVSSRDAQDNPVVAYVITGTAGVGKTSLALHWSNRVREKFPGGQLYIDLRGYDPGTPVTSDQALERFLLALGVPALAIPAGIEAKASLYRSVLADRKMLVILDNAGTVGQVRPLLPGASPCLAIITSRSLLSGLLVRDGAQRVTLQTLSEGESIQLLRETTTGYRVHDDPEEIAELARLCAYLPLALRIAAERAASRPGMPLSQLISDLRDESALWEALSTGTDEEADAVRTVFAWSYRALPENAARLFCLLGLHPGNEFSELAAGVLAEGTAGVRTSLDVLVGACLLENRRPGRYQYHDLLRAYAIDQARSSIPQDVQLATVARICDWYLHSAYNCALVIAHDSSLMPELDRAADFGPVTFADRRQAADWYMDERSNLAGVMAATVGTHLLRMTVQLAVVLDRIYASYNHFSDWRGSSMAGLEAARELGDLGYEAAMLESLGRLDRLTMQLDEAADFHRRAIALYRRADDQPSVAKGLNGLAWVYLFAHRIESAYAELTAALEIMRTLPEEDRRWTATILFSLGYTCLQLRQLNDGDSHLRESLQIFVSLGDRLYESMVLTGFSYLARLREQPDAALDYAERAVLISREMDNQLWEATALIYLGKAELASGRGAQALTSFQHASLICREEGDISRDVMAINGAGLAYRALGRPADAEQFYRVAVQLNRQLADRWKLARSLVYLADAIAGPERAEEARSYWQEARDILLAFPDPKSRALLAQVQSKLP
jgi:tetratricopeptide (TPR) repeat protein